jgi:hypothetical protein
VNENFITHASWLHERSPGMLVQRAPGVMLADSGAPPPRLIDARNDGADVAILKAAPCGEIVEYKPHFA